MSRKMRSVLAVFLCAAMVLGFFPADSYADASADMTVLNAVQSSESVYESNGIRVTFRLDGIWQGGYNATVRIENTGDKVLKNWKLAFDYPEEISNIWNAKISKYKNGKYTISNPGYNKNIKVGRSVEFGFGSNRDFTGFPTAYELKAKNRTASGTTYGVEYHLDNDWGSGFVATVTLSNPGSAPIESWELSFSFAREITNIWNAEIVSHEGNFYYLKNAEYNSDIPANGCVSFGFQGEGGSAEDTAYGFELISICEDDESNTPVPTGTSGEDLTQLEKELEKIISYNSDSDMLAISLQKDEHLNMMSGAVSDSKINSEADARQALAGIRTVLGIADLDQNAVFNGVYSDATGKAYSFSQKYKGVPVEAAYLTLITDNEGNTQMLKNRFCSLDMDVTPNITAEQAAAVAGMKATDAESELFICTQGGTPFLAWNLSCKNENGITKRAIVDAKTGALSVSGEGYVGREIPATYTDSQGVSHTLNYYNSGSDKIMADYTRGIYVYQADCPQYNTNDFSGEPVDEGEKFSKFTGMTRSERENKFALVALNDGNLSSNQDALAAYENIVTAYDFYEKLGYPVSKLWRSGKAGMASHPYLAVGVGATYEDILEENELTGTSIYYADTNTIGVGIAENGHYSAARVLRTLAHEYTHCVFNYMPDTNNVFAQDKYYEIHAIDEGYADVMSFIISNAPLNDWKVRKPATLSNAAGEVLRDCSKNILYNRLPETRRVNEGAGYNQDNEKWDATENPDDYFLHELDNVHFNSIVLSRACLYMLQSGKISYSDLTSLVMKTLVLGYGSNAGFAEVKENFTTASRCLLNSEQQAVVKEAFNFVGVTSEEFYVSGRVVEASSPSTPVVKAGIYVTDANGKIMSVISTGSEGRFAVRCPIGTYTVKARKTGYKSKSITISNIADFDAGTIELEKETVPTTAPIATPTSIPTSAPTITPISAPTQVPPIIPTAAPTSRPTSAPTSRPTSAPTSRPTSAPTSAPTSRPTSVPTSRPTSVPTSTPKPTATPKPTQKPAPTATPKPTQKPVPTATPKPTATPRPTEKPAPVGKLEGQIYNQEMMASKIGLKGTAIKLTMLINGVVSDKSYTTTVYTGNEGRFSVKSLPEGQYRVDIAETGEYEKVCAVVTVKAGETATFNWNRTKK